MRVAIGGAAYYLFESLGKLSRVLQLVSVNYFIAS